MPDLNFPVLFCSPRTPSRLCSKWNTLTLDKSPYLYTSPWWRELLWGAGNQKRQMKGGMKEEAKEKNSNDPHNADTYTKVCSSFRGVCANYCVWTCLRLLFFLADTSPFHTQRPSLHECQCVISAPAGSAGGCNTDGYAYWKQTAWRQRNNAWHQQHGAVWRMQG